MSVAIPEPFLDADFRRRRTINWLALGTLYALFYMSRYNFAATMHPLSQYFGWSNSDLGKFEFMMPLVYGLSVVFNGPIADRIGGRKAFLFGAVGAAIANALFGLCVLMVQTPAVVHVAGHHVDVVTPAVLSHGMTANGTLWLMVGIWGVNGYFQSFGALSIVKVNAQWFHVLERGTFAGIFGVLIRIGLLLAFSGVPFIAANFGLQWAYFVPGIAVFGLFVVNFIWLRDTPKDAGFEERDTGDGSSDNGDQPASLVFVVKKVFASKATWTIAGASMMIGMVRRSTVDSWNPKFFAQVYAPGGEISAFAPYQTAAWLIALCGILGGFAFGMTSDRRFGGRRAPVIVFGFVGMAVTLAAFGLSQRMGFGAWPAAICLGILSFFVNGAHGMVGGAASMDFGGRKAAATAAGLFDGMQYLAAAFVGPGMGWLLDNKDLGWSAWPFAPIPFAIIGALVMARLWNVRPGRSGH